MAEADKSGIVKRSAGFSRCRQYRYWLSREFAQGDGHCVFVGLNPSVGGVQNDDPTIRRCMGFASEWGYRKLSVVNLFAFRTPSPAVLKQADEPEGQGNRAALRRLCTHADRIVAAWGSHGTHLDQCKKFSRLLGQYPLLCFGTTANHQPIHPLYQRRDATLVPFSCI